MKILPDSIRARAVIPRAALVTALLLVGVAAQAGASAPRPGAGPRPQATVASAKADWRVDAANTGLSGATGPAGAPIQTFNAKVGFGTTAGLELDADGGVLFTIGGGIVYKYAAGTPGSKVWAFPATGSVGTYGADPAEPGAASPSNPVAGGDGGVYIGNDNGNLYQIADASGAGAAIFSTPSGAAIEQTPKIGPDGTLYVGASDGNFYHLTPPAVGSGLLATPIYTFTATGSVQPSS